MYHYTGCGLDNIWLVSGYRVENLGEYGQSVVVENVEELEKTIARHLVDQERPLTGQEFRYLRVMLDLSQTAMGRRLGKDYQTVARWEAAERKPGAAVRGCRDAGALSGIDWGAPLVHADRGSARRARGGSPEGSACRCPVCLR